MEATSSRKIGKARETLPLSLDRIYRRIELTPDSGVVPQSGDVLISTGKRGIGTRYYVLTAYRVKRRDPKAPARFQVGAQIIPVNAYGRARREITFRWRR